MIEDGERILANDLFLLVSREERTGVVTAHTQGGLGEVIRPEAEELSGLGDLIGHHTGSGNLNHRANQIGELHIPLFLDLSGNLVDEGKL